MTNPRLEKIYQEAGRLFLIKGYANTKMAEIAKASGIAVGTMYSAFSGKDAVFSFVLHAALDPEHFSGDVTLPIKPTAATELIPLLKRVDKILDSIMVITDDHGNICKDFPALAGELFDFFADYLFATDNIKKNAEIYQELREEYFPSERKYFLKLNDCLKRYMEAGQIRSFGYIISHASYLTDTMTWWALNANMQNPLEPVPRDTAKEICIGIIQRAYRADGKQKTWRGSSTPLQTTGYLTLAGINQNTFCGKKRQGAHTL